MLSSVLFLYLVFVVIIIWIIMHYFSANVYQKTGVSQGSRLYPLHLAQCLALVHAQHMLVPSLSTKGKLTPCLGLAIPNVLSARLSLCGPFPPPLLSSHPFPKPLIPSILNTLLPLLGGGSGEASLVSGEDNPNSSDDLI